MVLSSDSYPYDFREMIALCGIGDDELDRFDPASRMAAGLMTRCADLLTAAEALVEQGHPDACGVLLRSVVEGVVTAFWLLDDPKENLRTFAGQHLSNLERLARWSRDDAAATEELSFYRKQCQARGVEPLKQDLPKMSTRAASLWGEIRPLFRELSAELHATVRSADLALAMRASDKLVADNPYLFAPQDWLAQSAYLTLALAKRLHDAHDLDGRSEVDELYEDLRDWRVRRSGS